MFYSSKILHSSLLLTIHSPVGLKFNYFYCLICFYSYQFIYQMKRGVFFLFILFLISAQTDTLQLYTVSNTLSQVNQPTGSTSGGTTIYIRGLGFNANAAMNQVFVGPYPCNIPADGATQTTIACITSSTGQNNNIYGLPIIVISNGQQKSLTNEQGSFSYLSSQTPIVQALYPASAVPGTLVKFYGIHRISLLGDGLRDMGDVRSMLIGKSICGRFDIIQGPIKPNNPDTISCTMAGQQQAGKYQISQYLVPGYSIPAYLLQRSSFIQEYYHFAVLPGVRSVSPNIGSTAGQQLTIIGSGFSTNTSVVNVSVNGTVCDVVSSSLTQIVCNLRPQDTTTTSKLPTNSNNQVNGYFSGSGLNYKRYDITKLTPQSITGLRTAIQTNSSQITLQQSSYRGEIKSGNYYGTYFGQAFTGYFTAPVDGVYTFQGVADDTFALYISSTYGSTEPTASPLIFSNSRQNSIIYIGYSATAQSTITLSAGKSYYIEAYHINYGGDSFFDISVQIPNTDTTLTWQTHAVHTLQLNFTNDPEIVVFNQTGGTGGQLNLTVITKVLGAPPIVQYSIVNYNATIGEFLAALNQLSCFGPYQISGKQVLYDITGSITSNISQVYTYSWEVSIWLVRNSASQAAKITPYYLNYTGIKSFVQATVHNHGPLISGTFGLILNGVPVTYSGSPSIPATITAGYLQSSINSIPGFQNTVVHLTSTSSQSYGSTWLILFYGVNGLLPAILTDSTNLIGGVPGTQPNIYSNILRNYSPNLLMDPIDFNLLNTPSSTTNVLVTINDLPSVCIGSCSYQFLTNTPLLTTATISNSIVTLSLTDPANINYTLSNTTITIAGQPCTILNLTSPINNFQCQLPTNPNGSPTVPAGTYSPVVTVTQVGTVPHAPAVVPFNFPLTLVSLNVTSGGTNGGFGLHLIGTGFPTSLTPGTTVNICGVSATITVIDNNNAYIIMPPCTQGTKSISLTAAGLTTNALPFTYNSPANLGSIFTVTPQSYNPSLKGIMNITGSGFGTNPSAVRVDLANATGKVYQMRILTLNDTFIKVGIPGGLAGHYKVQVNVIGQGEIMPDNSTCNDFTYELVINSVTPTSGSFNGGTLIHLKGINFATALDQTLVFVGIAINWMCTVETLNQTDLTCRTPPANEDYNISIPQTVYLQNRLMVDNTCGGSCVFTYLDKSSSPQLTSISATVIASGSVVLTGYNLNLYSPKVVLINTVTGISTITTPTSISPTSLTFTLPNVESGTYTVRARLDPLGQSNGLLLNVTTALISTTPLSLSTNGGRVALSGTGFPAVWPNSQFILTILSSGNLVPPTIFSSTTAALTLLLPASSSPFKITLTSPVGNTVSTLVTPSSSYTPQLTLTSSTPKTAGSNSFTFSKVNLQNQVPTYVEVYSLINPNELYNITIPTQTLNTSIQFNTILPGGLFGFRFYYAAYGYATSTDNVAISITQPTIATNIVGSYNGGTITLTGAGLSPSATLKVNGFSGTLSNITNTNAIGNIPPFVSTLTQAQYNLASPQKLTLKQFTIISDTPTTNANPFDGKQGTIYNSNSTSECFIGIDVGNQLTLNLTRIRFFPNSRWLIAANYLVGATIQASNDNLNYDIIGSIDSTVHTGWNILPINNIKTFRYFKFVHNIVSQCQLAQLEFTGILLSNNNIASLTTNQADIVYNDGANTFTFQNAIQFRQDHTPIIQSLSKTTGDVFGGYPLTITGKYLNFATPTILIDLQPCTVTSSSMTSLTCTVSARLSLPSHNSFSVSVGNNNAIINQIFSYVLRWSDIRTWGTDMPPIDGDLIYVPKGMNLLVDESTPKLKGILVQNGTLTFADQSDMIISAGFIAVDGGKFIAGTEQHPYQHKLTFVMYGSYYGPQLPMFGNKGIGCMECFISIHGQVRNFPWTELASTANIGTNTITVQDPVDWQIGEEIVIASTSFDHYEAERRTITAINGKTIQLNASLIHQHFAGIQDYGNDKVEMRAEVALLTRNIKMTGDSTSQQRNYGSHLMMAGSAENGLIANIAYTEFFNCGQPVIIGRYCIHFHMNGDVSDSFVRGNAVHDSMARVVTLHGVHFLTVQYNVGYNVKGHNFFVQDGIETNNLIQYNLAISSIQVWTMLQTDISVASFWITHPSNHFRYNHAAGSDFYGFWYQIKPNPDGPSATSDICPMGNALGESHHNVAHSNVRFGLRIFKLAPRTYPCQPLYIQDQIDPWGNNPPIISNFYTYTLYKNGQCGLLAEQTGNLIFNNITSIQNKRAGAEFYVTEFTEEPVQLINSVMVGQTLTNLPQDITGAKGIITPRLGNIKIDNVRFYNYPANTHSLETCSYCDNPLLFTNTAQEIYISNITYHNVQGYKLFMNGLKRQILYDLDGSFTTTAFDGTQRTSAAITNSYRHLLDQPACTPTNNVSAWDNTIACDQTVKVARVTFNSAQSASVFRFADLKAQLIPTVNYQVSQNSTAYTHIYSFFSFTNTMDTMELPMTWALPYIAGRTYNIWWWTGPDFTSLQMFSSHYLKHNDPAILFKFNYTEHRQLYDIGPNRPGQPLTDAYLFYPSPAYLDANDCDNGNYFHDDTAGQRTLQVCASAQNRTYFQKTIITAVPCRYLCPTLPGQFVKQSFVRLWSNATQWPGERMPLPGENVTVNGSWTIIMDVDPAPCSFMQIDGDVIIQDKQDRNVTCEAIWIRAGSLTAGSPSAPFTHQLTFQLNGKKNDPGWIFDPALQGTKIFVITGELSLYGTVPTTVQTKLTSSAFAGDTEITVDNANGWAVDDVIVIAPSFSSSAEYERVTITAVNGNIVTVNPPLQFTHYGSNSITIDNTIGQLDTRGSVGHVSRPIKFVSGPDSGWGYTVVVYQMWDDLLTRVGNAILSGVEFTLGGQYGSEAASLNLMNNKDTSAGTTIVQYSSFSHCRTYCLYALTHINANITNNVFYQGSNFHLKLTSISNFNVHNNLMIAAVFPPNLPVTSPTACLELTNTDPITENNKINNNVCQGSKLNGYIFPFIPCQQLANNPFFNNLVGSAEGNGFLLTRVTTDTCLSFSGVRAYACTVGQIANPPGTAQLQYTQYIMADNKRSLSLRFGLAGTDRTAIVSNSYFTQISRPTCTECYTNSKTSCSGNQAIRLLAVTVNGESYPMSFTTGFDGLCREEALDSKSYFYNVTFDHYRTTYTQPALSACKNNILFRANPGGMDLVGSAYLTNSTCTNCDFNSMAYFDPPNPNELGWFGGCGNILCTGRNNYIIQDQTGSLFPTSGVLLANNSWIGSKVQNCTHNPTMNGYYCTRHDFAVLEYESIAPDYNKRIMWPVTLSYTGGNWTTLTNGYREWAWIGNEPQNLRLGRFISTLQLYQYYNMSFASNPPNDMRLQIQKRFLEGNNSDWVVVTIYYPFPNAIAVLVDDVTIKPISLLDNNSQNGVNVSKCGSNIFFFKNYTIQFVVTGDINCLVRVTLTNSVQLTLHFAMNINDFWSVNGPTRLVDRVCAVLGIVDQSQVKIVGIYSGSVEAVVVISAPTTPSNQSTTVDPAQGLVTAQGYYDTLNSALVSGSLNTALMSGGVGPLIDSSLLLLPMSPSSNSSPSNNDSNNTSTILIGVFVSIGVVVLITIIVIIYLKKRSANKVVDLVPQISEDAASVNLKQQQEVQNVTEENISEIVFESKH